MKTSAQVILFSTLFQSAVFAGRFRLPSFLPKALISGSQYQEPMMNIPISVPGSSDNGNKDSSNDSSDLSISDVIGKERLINIFAGFTRDIAPISSRLDDPKSKSTVLAPTNSALQKLPRKPWEDPKDYDAAGAEAYKGESGEDRATRNLRRFVEAHTVPVSPWREGEKVESLRGETVWWEKREGNMFVQPGNIEVECVVSKVGNGEVWVLRACLNYV